MMLSVFFAMTLSADPIPNESAADVQGVSLFSKRVQARLRDLQTPLPIDRPLPDTSLRDILDFLQDLATPPEAAKDASKRVVIVADHPAFKKFKSDPAFNVEEEKINLPKLNGVSLETVLKQVAEQVHGTFLIRGEYILVTTWEGALGRQLKPEEDRVTLIHWAVDKKPLADVLSNLSERYDCSIVISNGATEKSKLPVSAKFLNVPLEDAVETLADMNGLKVVRKPNLFYLTEAPVPAAPKVAPKEPTFIPR